MKLKRLHSSTKAMWVAPAAIGDLFSTGDVCFVVEDHVENAEGEQLFVRCTTTHEARLIPKQVFLKHLAEGNLRRIERFETQDQEADLLHVTNAVLTASPAAKAVMLSRINVLNALAQLGYAKFSPRTTGVSLAVKQACKNANERDVSVETLYRAKRKLDAADNDPAALLPKFNARGGIKKSRLASEEEDAIQRALDQIKEDKHKRITPTTVKRLAKSLLTEESKDASAEIQASLATIGRRIDSRFTKRDVVIRNNGRETADRILAEDYPRGCTEMPLSRAETDDTDGKTFLICPRTGLPFGRAHITPVVDVASRACLSILVGIESRSTQTLLSAVFAAMLPKDLSARGFEDVTVLETANLYGRIGYLALDNPPQNHAGATKHFAKDRLLILGWAKPYSPQDKPIIEGFNARLKRECLRELHGYKGEEVDDISKGMRNAVMTVDDFTRVVTAWAFNDYNTSPAEKTTATHLSYGLSPLQRFFAGIREFSILQTVPRDIQAMKLAAMMPETRSIRDSVLWFRGLPYSGPATVALQRKYGNNTRCEFRYDPNNMARVYVKDPSTSTYAPADCAYAEYAEGLTEYQQSLIVKVAKENAINNPSLPALHDARRKLHEFTTQLAHSKKLRERQRAAKIGNVSNAPTEDVTKGQQKKPGARRERVTELQATIEEVDEVPLIDDEDGWRL